MPKSGPRRRVVAFCYVTSMFMSAMDMHIVNVALPSLAREFRSSLSSAQWTVLGYVLSLAIVIPASGWFGDRYGSKKVFLMALSTFTTGSALCGMAGSLPELVICRVVQGIGGGALVPVGTAMLYRAYPPAERARVTRVLTMPIIVAPAAAPVLGGFLVTRLSWRWVFYVNVPIGLVALTVSALFLAEHRQVSEGRFDIVGFVLSGGGLALVLYAVSESPTLGWGSPLALGSLALGLACCACFVRLERHQDHPLLNLGLLADRLFRAMSVVSVFSTASFFGILFLTPVFLQEVMGQSALGSGLTTFIEAVGVVVASQTVGHFYGTIGPRRLATVGSVVLSLLLLGFLAVHPGTSLWWVRLIMFFCGFFNSNTLMSVQAFMFTTIKPEDTGHASAIYTTQRQASIAMGVAVLSTVVVSMSHHPLEAFHVAYLVAAASSLVAALAAAILVHDSDAWASMSTRRQVRQPVG